MESFVTSTAMAKLYVLSVCGIPGNGSVNKIKLTSCFHVTGKQLLVNLPREIAPNKFPPGFGLGFGLGLRWGPIFHGAIFLVSYFHALV